MWAVSPWWFKGYGCGLYIKRCAFKSYIPPNLFLLIFDSHYVFWVKITTWFWGIHSSHNRGAILRVEFVGSVEGFVIIFSPYKLWAQWFQGSFRGKSVSFDWSTVFRATTIQSYVTLGHPYDPRNHCAERFTDFVTSVPCVPDAWKSPKTQNNSWYASRRTQRMIDEFEDFFVEYPVSRCIL